MVVEDPAVVVSDELVVTVVVNDEELVVAVELVAVVELEPAVELVGAGGSALPPERSSPSVSSCDWDCLLIQFCTSVWFS